MLRNLVPVLFACGLVFYACMLLRVALTAIS